MIDEIADMHHAAGVVERLPMHRQPRMAGRAEQGEDFAQWRIDSERDDVGARHHDVGDSDIMQAEHIG